MDCDCQINTVYKNILYSLCNWPLPYLITEKTVSFPKGRKKNSLLLFIIIFPVFDKSVLSAYQLHLITYNPSLW